MIKLKNGYFIESDGTQYILKVEKEGIRKETKEPYTYEVIRGFYGCLGQALNGYYRCCLLEKVKREDLTLDEIKTLIKELHEEIKAYEGGVSHEYTR